MITLRITAAATLIAILTACGGGELPVRDGPQAVHPSGSALSKGTTLAVDTVQTATYCGHHAHHCQNVHGGHINDGSTPIID